MATVCLRRIVCTGLKHESRVMVSNFTRRDCGAPYLHTLTKLTTGQAFPLNSLLTSASWALLKISHFSDVTNKDQEVHDLKPDPRERKAFGNVGRKIPHRILQVFNENGENLGHMHRADVIRVMDESGLKLVLLKDTTDPPVYRLMTGKQIYEEQIKLREKEKAKTGITQVKELGFSSDIANHDLEIKTKQIKQWLEKKHHVRITVRGKSASTNVEKMEILLEGIVQSIPNTATFASKPKVMREGKAMMCILRHLSEKELNELKKQDKKNTQGNEISPQDSQNNKN